MGPAASFCVRVAALTLAGALLALPAAQAFRYVGVGAPAPALMLADLEGRPQVVPRPGQPTVLVFWRPGQPLSEAALRDLEALGRSTSGAGVEIVAVAERDEDPEASRAAARRFGLRFLVDPAGRAAEAWGVIVYPSTAVIGRERRLVAYLPSRPGTYPQAVQREALRAKGPEPSGSAGARESAAERARAAYKRGVALAGDRRWDAAAAAFREALETAPDLVDARLRLGYVQLELGEAARALEAFAAVLGENPASPGGRIGVGIARLRLGQTEEGIRLLEEAVTLNPDPVRGHYELGRAYEARGDHGRALAHYKRAYEKLSQGRR